MINPALTVVLVHGAWHGSWCWQKLVPQLQKRGLGVRTVDLPSVGAAPGQVVDLSADATTVKSVIADVRGPVVLCGHSYAGMVISEAAVGQRTVKRLVYVCAFVPDDRESLLSIGGGKHAPWINELAGGLTLPDPRKTANVFYSDCDVASQQWAIKQLLPQSAAAFTEAVQRPAWKEIPSTYVVCGNDMALPPDLQRNVFAPRATEKVEMAASHSPFMSRPAELAEILLRAAQQPTT